MKNGKVIFGIDPTLCARKSKNDDQDKSDRRFFMDTRQKRFNIDP